MSPERVNDSIQTARFKPRLGKRAVRKELKKILAGREFLRSARLPEFLCFVVEESLAGRSADLIEYTVATRALGKSETFDSSQDPCVRILAGRLRRALDRYYIDEGKGDPIRIDIPTGTYVPTFHWQSSSSDEPKAVETTSVADKRPSVAVLPVLDQSDDQIDSRFADGLTYELTTALARCQDLRVIVAPSDWASNGRYAKWAQISRDLNVRFVLDGSLWRTDDSVKFASRLIDTKDGNILWCEKYHRDLTPSTWIELQEDIARRVVAKVASESGTVAETLSQEIQGKPPEQLDSYEAMLLFRHWHYCLTPEAFSASFAALERAVAQDPEYAPALAALSNLYGSAYCLDIPWPGVSIEKARSFAERAVELAPRDQFVRLRLAHIFFLENREESFVEEAERGIALNPNNPHLGGLCGMLFTYFGLWERGLQLLNECAELNQNYPTQIHSGLFLYHFHLGDYERAYEEAVKMGHPTLFWVWINRACALGHLGRRAEAEAAAQQLLKTKPDFPLKARDLIGRYVKVDTLVDRMLDGLCEAGLRMWD